MGFPEGAKVWGAAHLRASLCQERLNELNSHLICLMDVIIIWRCSDPSHLELEVLCEAVSLRLPLLQLRKWGQSHGQFLAV